MKRIISVILMCLPMMTYGQTSDRPFFNFNYNNSFSVNVGYNHIGAVDQFINGQKTSPQCESFAVQVTACGVMADINFGMKPSDYYKWNPRGEYVYDGHRAYSWHLGYKIPITRWLFVSPLMGKTYYSVGVYDSKYYTVYANTREYEYFEKYILVNNFDYGVNVGFTIANHFNVDFNVTRYNIGISFGFKIPVYLY